MLLITHPKEVVVCSPGFTYIPIKKIPPSWNHLSTYYLVIRSLNHRASNYFTSITPVWIDYSPRGLANLFNEIAQKIDKSKGIRMGTVRRAIAKASYYNESNKITKLVNIDELIYLCFGVRPDAIKLVKEPQSYLKRLPLLEITIFGDMTFTLRITNTINGFCVQVKKDYELL